MSAKPQTAWDLPKYRQIDEIIYKSALAATNIRDDELKIPNDKTVTFVARSPDILDPFIKTYLPKVGIGHGMTALN